MSNLAIQDLSPGQLSYYRQFLNSDYPDREGIAARYLALVTSPKYLRRGHTPPPPIKKEDLHCDVQCPMKGCKTIGLLRVNDPKIHSSRQNYKCPSCKGIFNPPIERELCISCLSPDLSFLSQISVGSRIRTFTCNACDKSFYRKKKPAIGVSDE